MRPDWPPHHRDTPLHLGLHGIRVLARRQAPADAAFGEERAATEARDQARAELPASLPRFATHLELHCGLMPARSGDRAGGIAHATAATAAMDALPPEKHSLTLRMLLSEIKA
ncbi:hypothetical protein [Streptomyces vinaceus]|uniref:hypothetical protein n=1 Tax=Streptomyces vinaceus TaxID=1960 RepID=UPI0036765C1F